MSWSLLWLSVGCAVPGVELAPEPIPFEVDRAGGFDDWSSDGAALGYAVDEAAGRILVVGMRFELPVYRETFQVAGAPEEGARGWATRAPDALAEDAAEIPLLGAALTDTAGVRALPSPLVAILLEGDLQSEQPDRIWASAGGEVVLTREDSDLDRAEGALDLYAVSDLGEDAARILAGEGPDALRIDGIDFSWHTADQPGG